MANLKFGEIAAAALSLFSVWMRPGCSGVRSNSAAEATAVKAMADRTAPKARDSGFLYNVMGFSFG
ncbi:hypothetical protein ACFX5Q_13090 [Mesorhizobium sp. IMUNJ 23033]|uniref:hypothetical protein n=1 Tax=Mesorhizobium sp. IMUNJ 23033 TaxID=3378039 RepID=UPI00384BD9AD